MHHDIRILSYLLRQIYSCNETRCRVPILFTQGMCPMREILFAGVHVGSAVYELQEILE